MQRHILCEPQRFLQNGGTLEALEQKYGIEVRRHPIMSGLVQLKYGKINSDFSSNIVRQCRGLILDSYNDWKVVARPFDKFFNHGEPHAAQIDWRTATVQEKLDGSLLILYHHNGMWNVATTGAPSANGSVHGFEKMTFANLFWQTWYANKMPLPGPIHWGHTFMFELTSPYNRVVVKHDQSRLRLIGVRNNQSGAELPVSHFWDYDTVQAFPVRNGYSDLFRSFDEIDPCEQEGYIVVDADFNRVKVKHPGYVALHHMRSSISPKNVLEVVRQGESAEVLAHFPEWTQIFEVVQGRYDGLVMQLEQDWSEMPQTFQTRKEFAEKAMNSHIPGAMFSLLDGRHKNIRQFLEAMHIDKLAAMLAIGSMEVKV